jgi:SAM-dependent methyltransferase
MYPAVGGLIDVTSGRPCGTVFAVTNRLALTAYHCIGDRNAGVIRHRRLRCRWTQGVSDATVVAGDPLRDIALLRLNRVLPPTLEAFQLATGETSEHTPYTALGVPAEVQGPPVFAVSGEVTFAHSHLSADTPAIQLFCREAETMGLYGLSGAPVLAGNPRRVIGILRWNQPSLDHPGRAVGSTVFASPATAALQLWPQLATAPDLEAILRRMAYSNNRRSDATIRADVESFLLAARLNLAEHDIRPFRASEQEFLIQRGLTVIRIERDLREAEAALAAEDQLAQATAAYGRQGPLLGAALLTDGVKWLLYRPAHRRLQRVDAKDANPRKPSELAAWLEAVLATGENLLPSRDQIEQKLGASSPSYKLDSAELLEIYSAYSHLRTVQVKRKMWAKLLTTASGIAFLDTTKLFTDHTLLVATAKVIGHALLKVNLDDPDLTAKAIMSGSAFAKANIRGVIEADFFDWITEVPRGDLFIKKLTRRLRRFSWEAVDHDVLKLLYESIITKEVRHQLGEYYTPDWLSEKITHDRVTDPLNQRVLDASCGSGTFLFHAIQRYIRAADVAGIQSPAIVDGVVRNVIGIDVHPVAVALARVTYLLALGTERLNASRLGFTVPVYLGDSLRWGQEHTGPLGQELLPLFRFDGLSVSTRLDPESFVAGPPTPSHTSFAKRLNFPDQIVRNTGVFDELVTELVDLATRREARSAIPPLTMTFERFGISGNDGDVIRATFAMMCRLHDRNEDHIWGYYLRNLARPLWLARPNNRVDVLVGNPPWLAQRYMTENQKEAFRAMSIERGLWVGGSVTTNQDLAGLFVVRCIELYLRPGGSFGYVMPWAALPRARRSARSPYFGFRTGNYRAKEAPLKIAFEQPWDLHGIRPAIFPLPSSVIFGWRQPADFGAVAMPVTSEVWSGRLPTKRCSWADAARYIMRDTSEMKPAVPKHRSPYYPRFYQGATAVPRSLFMVRPDDPGSLGIARGQRAIRSRRPSSEKKPWKDLPDVTGTVETQFVRPMFLGECVLPFRLLPALEAVIPWDGDRLLDGHDARLRRYRALADWLDKAEERWTTNHVGRKIRLIDQLDYLKKLSNQFPGSAYRVVYNKSGSYLAAAVVTDSSILIDHKLYWGSTASLDEARFLAATINSTVLLTAVQPLQSRGEHNTRDFDKLPFELPVPLYDVDNPDHRRLVELAVLAETIAAEEELPNKRFETQRAQVRRTLERKQVLAQIDAIVKIFFAE